MLILLQTRSGKEVVKGGLEISEQVWPSLGAFKTAAPMANEWTSESQNFPRLLLKQGWSKAFEQLLCRLLLRS